MLPVGFKAFVLSKHPELEEPRLESLLDLAIRNVHIPSIGSIASTGLFFSPHQVMRRRFGEDYSSI